MDGRTVGVLGGGQLGRMMAEAGHRLGVKVAVLDPLGTASPAGQVAELAVEGSFRDADKIRELAELCDVLTVEIEHVNCEILSSLEASGVRVHPSPKTIRVVQDKYAQKEHFKKHGVPMPRYMDTPTEASVREAGTKFGYPLMLKAKKMAYDGKGNAPVMDEGGVAEAFSKLGGKDLYVEAWAEFEKELAVMVVRGDDAEIRVYPVVETVQLDNVCHTTLTPARVSTESAAQAVAAARRAVESLWGAGVFGVELFLLKDGSVLLNEIAPRPHNSGHYTYEACECDQFENHVRAVMGLPLGGTGLRVGASLMLNVLGDRGGSMEETTKVLKQALSVPGAAVHWYGKAEARAGRKMAHVTFCAGTMEELERKVGPFGLLQSDAARSASAAASAPAGGESTKASSTAADAGARPLVSIIMGSDSDLPTMKASADMLERFGVPYELTIVSAHRTPARMTAFAASAASRGIRAIIAGAGGAAHLPGMVAAMTPLPVIGVPVKTSTLSGVDSLHSIVQMPRGVPVATVGIGNATNAGLLAVRILASAGEGGAALLRAMSDYMAKSGEEVEGKAAAMEEQGWKSYLAAKADKSTTVGV
ncbi:unnamed protein product [Scytosiphon promiscuus]